MTKFITFLERMQIFMLGSFATLLFLRLDGYEGLNNYTYWTMGLALVTLITPELRRRSRIQKNAVP
ncbi:hypothetical protein [Sphingopyxis fribergensis]